MAGVGSLGWFRTAAEQAPARAQNAIGWRELLRLQAARKGAEVQLPVAADVTIDAALPSAENEP